LKYELFIEKSAQKELSKIQQQQQDRIVEAIRKLSGDPRPSGVKKLSGREARRIRVGDYRIIYDIDDNELTVLIVNIGHRKEIYRK